MARPKASPKPAPLTLTVPEAGHRYFKLTRNAAYAAVARGEIPVLRFGRLMRVPVRALEQMLDQAVKAK
jgi:excisionase family DNA binding protein